ncbi:hypothetical protein BSY16_5645 (plasmid) [Sinorhizobium sp. RAC02]|nr:hypothetical protein BSY16_5645 [Sinorhizobium sp. RAC02]
MLIGRLDDEVSVVAEHIVCRFCYFKNTDGPAGTNVIGAFGAVIYYAQNSIDYVRDINLIDCVASTLRNLDFLFLKGAVANVH